MDQRPLWERAAQAERLSREMAAGPDRDRLLKLAADLREQAEREDGAAQKPPAAR